MHAPQNKSHPTLLFQTTVRTKSKCVVRTWEPLLAASWQSRGAYMFSTSIRDGPRSLRAAQGNKDDKDNDLSQTSYSLLSSSPASRLDSGSTSYLSVWALCFFQEKAPRSEGVPNLPETFCGSLTSWTSTQNILWIMG